MQYRPERASERRGPLGTYSGMDFLNFTGRTNEISIREFSLIKLNPEMGTDWKRKHQ